MTVLSQKHCAIRVIHNGCLLKYLTQSKFVLKSHLVSEENCTFYNKCIHYTPYYNVFKRVSSLVTAQLAVNKALLCL